MSIVHESLGKLVFARYGLARSDHPNDVPHPEGQLGELGILFVPFATGSCTCDDEGAKGHGPLFELIECQDLLSHILHRHTSREPVQFAAEVIPLHHVGNTLFHVVQQYRRIRACRLS